MGRLQVLALAAVAGWAMVGGSARAGQTSSITDTGVGGATVDGTLSPNEYGPGNTYKFTGGGSGFGGTLGGANAALYMKRDASNLYIGFQPGANLNDIVVLHLDTKAGGFTDAQMNDTGDGSRRAASNISGTANDVFPTGILPDYAVTITQFGVFSFELTPGPLNFIVGNTQPFDTGNDAAKFREFSIPLSQIGNPAGAINFFASYVNDAGDFTSNESIPAEAFNGSGNPGNGTADIIHANYDTLTVVPEPASLGLLGVGLAALAFRRRRA